MLEDDHSGAISTAPDVSLASWLPERVLHVRSFSKSHGPDLRIGALGGPRALVDRVVARRLLGPGWTSRMMQALLYELLTDPDVGRRGGCRAASGTPQRQRELAAAVQLAGGELRAGDGHQHVAAGRRRASRHRAAGGGRHPGGAGGAVPARRTRAEFVRVTVGMVRDDVATVGAALAAAAIA